MAMTGRPYAALDELQHGVMEMIDLRWEGDDENQWLFAGANDTELAWLEKRRTLWSACIWLPGVDRGKEYNTLAAHQKNISEKVAHWFELAGAYERPVVQCNLGSGGEHVAE
jgi:hypothetical protein